MISSFLPLDFSEPSDQDTSLLGERAQSNLPSKPPRSRDKWDSARSAALHDPNDLQKWDNYLSALDNSWESVGVSEDAKSEMKTAISAAYKTLLARFPYLTSYWKRFSIVLYKIGGLEESIKCLKAAVTSFPQSLALWVDYLSALMAELEQVKDEASKNEKIDLLRAEFSRSSDLIGLNFNSDPFWNKYIEFETKYATENPSPQLLRVLQTLITIPLYQYAQYNQQFAELSKSFPLSEVVSDKTELKQLLSQYGKSENEALSTVEQQQIVDAYAYNVFVETQRKVNDKWVFESALSLHEFSPADLPAIEAQRKEWIKYLDHEIESFEQNQTDTSLLKLIGSLFERALVPNCLDGQLWQKYATFQQRHQDEKSVNKIYLRAIFSFVPLDQPLIREKYVSYLMEKGEFEEANEFLLRTIRLYSGLGVNNIFAKTPYLHDVKEILKLWSSHIDAAVLLPHLETLVTGYFERIDRYKKENSIPSADVEGGKFEFKASYCTTLSKYLNDYGICLVVVKYLQTLENSAESATTIRKFYNKYFKEPAFAQSVQFWKFFVDYESEQRNIINLRSVVKHVKTATALPKPAIDALIDIYYEFTCANLASCMSLSTREDLLDVLVNVDAEKSEDLYVNLSARARLAANNYIVKGSQKREEQYMTLRSKHLDHPGVFTDSAPEITNNLMDGEWISLLDDHLEPPPLPTFRNLDKANAPINYEE